MKEFTPSQIATHLRWIYNQPGYYKEGAFGIRIENLIYVKKNKKNIQFKNLTLAPIDMDLINFKMLNSAEKKYIHNYHLDIYLKISKHLNRGEKKWILDLI